ncbi:hypothetical protein [Beijerinckia mobilis]|uniref:hypothetical protein n=1 Tax=Beijerinckia mobilis TaxID=231434 RepID=UPI000557C126|nr:hypothetical protein [Beijerinckia mobilis]
MQSKNRRIAGGFFVRSQSWAPARLADKPHRLGRCERRNAHYSWRRSRFIALSKAPRRNMHFKNTPIFYMKLRIDNRLASSLNTREHIFFGLVFDDCKPAALNYEFFFQKPVQPWKTGRKVLKGFELPL